MLFEKEKYYKYIGTLQNIVNFAYAVIMLICFLIGSIGGPIGGLLGIGIGFLLATTYTIVTKIKIQEMKWKMDIYERIK